VTEFDSKSFVKICGVTNIHDAHTVISSGANAFGLILARSSRRVSRENAEAICDATSGEILRTLVFRENSDEYILESVARIDADLIQLHGPLSVALGDALRTRDLRIVKALAIGSDEFLTFDDRLVDAVLVDGPVPGSGTAHSWTALRDRSFTKPLIVAGGLNPDNVVETIDVTGAWGVDCASGVEESPGIKDPTLVTQFVRNARRGFEERGV